MNLQSSEYADNKGYCEDLTEGKFSFPVVHGVRADLGNRQILSESFDWDGIRFVCADIVVVCMSKSLTADVLQKRTTSVSLKKHTVDYLRHTTESFDYTRTVLLELRARLDGEIARLGGNKALEKIVEALNVPEELD